MAFVRKPKKLPLLNLTERVVQDILGQFDDHVKRYDVMIPHCMTQTDSEADLFGIRASGFCDEFEIKLSRSDFLRDRKKVVTYRRRHPSEVEGKTLPPPENAELAPWEKFKLDALIDGDMMANYFWYVIKAGIVDYSAIPDFAGVIEVDHYGLLKVVRSPEKLHGRKLSFEQRFKYASLLSARFWKYRSNAT